MWARTVEVMLGLWLAASPFIFRHPSADSRLWWNDLLCSFLVLAFSLLSYHDRTRRAHLLNIAVGLWLIAFGYFAFSHPPPPAAQNNLVLGVLLLMFAIIPSQATLPPRGWREYEARRRPPS